MLAPDTLGKKYGVVGLPCPLFRALVLFIFTSLLGDEFLDLTSGDVCGVVGVPYSCSSLGVSTDSSDSSSPSDIGSYSSSSL